MGDSEDGKVSRIFIYHLFSLDILMWKPGVEGFDPVIIYIYIYVWYCNPLNGFSSLSLLGISLGNHTNATGRGDAFGTARKEGRTVPGLCRCEGPTLKTDGMRFMVDILKDIFVMWV